MITSIHGHEVIEMMVASGRAYTEGSLLADIITHFGPDARFYTCSAENMTAPELILFLKERGKFMPVAEGFQFDESTRCKH